MNIKQQDYSQKGQIYLTNSLYKQSIAQVNQYNEIKKILNNLSFNYKKGKKILNCQIIMDLTNELKRERKMFMSIKDPNMAHFYIDVDFEKAQELIDLNKADEVPYKVQELLKQKQRQS